MQPSHAKCLMSITRKLTGKETAGKEQQSKRTEKGEIALLIDAKQKMKANENEN